MSRSVTRAQIGTDHEGLLIIGKSVFINEGVIIHAVKSIEIGDFTKIGDNSTIHDSDYHALDAICEVRVEKVILGKNVWIGRNVVILPGVSIGDNSVVAAGSIVTRSVPENAVVAGNPGRVLDRILNCPEGFVRS